MTNITGLACNPYIKEHAVMCLKFLLESNPENQALVSSLEAREVVQPDTSTKETLDKMGVEVQIGEDGKPRVLRTRGEARGRERAARRGPSRGRQSGYVEEVDDAEIEGQQSQNENGHDSRKGKERETLSVQGDEDDEIEFM